MINNFILRMLFSILPFYLLSSIVLGQDVNGEDNGIKVQKELVKVDSVKNENDTQKEAVKIDKVDNNISLNQSKRNDSVSEIDVLNDIEKKSKLKKLLNNKKVIYATAGIGAIAIIILNIQSEEKTPEENSTVRIGPPPGWPDGP